MKRLISFFLAIFIPATLLIAQPDVPAVDQSPMDMSYYPAGYPILKIQDKITESPVARVVYSRPRKEGRVIFGGLVTYGQVWRLGANEATEIEFFKSVRIGGKKVQKGRYTLYGLINENSWILIINKETDTWGSFKYNQSKDLLRIEVPVQKTNETIESLSMYFESATAGFKLNIAWDNLRVSLPVYFLK